MKKHFKIKSQNKENSYSVSRGTGLQLTERRKKAGERDKERKRETEKEFRMSERDGTY